MFITREDKIPVYEQIYIKYKDDIIEGRLKENERLPAERNLATKLQVSRGTVNLAYEQLFSEGYIRRRARSGYFVNKIEGILSPKKERREFNQRDEKPLSYRYDFTPFATGLDSFPYKTWKRLYKEVLSNDGEEIFRAENDRNSLKETISNYLYKNKGIDIDSHKIIIGAGTEYLIQLLALIINKDFKIAMENPTYIKIYKLFKALNREIVGIGLGEDGIDIEELKKSKANLVYLMPTHQFPTGSVMPITKRREVLNFAKDTNGYIIEDDYDGEFRYRGLPIPPLKAIDTEDVVIYLGTFSNTISQTIRVAFMILPDKLFDIYKEKLNFITATTPMIEQAVLRQFIEGGYYERQINLKRTLYKSRHDLLLSKLKIFSDLISIRGENAGLYVVVTFRIEMSEEEFTKIVREAGIRLYGISEYYIDKKNSQTYPTVLIGYGNIKEEDIIMGIDLLYLTIKKYIYSTDKMR